MALTDDEKGRIIRILRLERQWVSRASSAQSYFWSSDGQWRRSSVRRFTDAQIAEALTVTLKELRRLAALYDRTHPRWTDDRIRRGVIRFLRTQKRWPTKADFRRLSYLPSQETYTRRAGHMLLNDFLTSSEVRTLSPAVILAIPNATIRRDAIEAYGGVEWVIRDSGSQPVQQDDFGKLWHVPDGLSLEPTAVYVEVENATAVGGERDHYFLRVPPTVRTAKEAVEWTFNIPVDELEEFAAAT